MMGDWKYYIIFCFGEQVDYEIARSKKEACDLYIEKCKEEYIEDFGSEPTNDMIEDAYENINVFEAADLSDDADFIWLTFRNTKKTQ